MSSWILFEGVGGLGSEYKGSAVIERFLYGMKTQGTRYRVLLAPYSTVAPLQAARTIALATSHSLFHFSHVTYVT